VTGDELEQVGQALLQGLGFTCVSELRHVRLIDLDSGGPHGADDHIELDYLIPYGNTCILGEITSRHGSKSLSRKYDRFCHHVDIISRAFGRKRSDRSRRAFFQQLGVPDDTLRRFRGVSEFRGFFLTTEQDRSGINFDARSAVPILYRHDWLVLREYEKSIGCHAAPAFLERLDLAPIQSGPQEQICFTCAEEALLLSRHRRFSLVAESECDVLVFEADPYKLLPRSRVYRRESLTQERWPDSKHYQRALSHRKLRRIREQIPDPDESGSFMFPGSILVVLSRSCRFDPEKKELMIPNAFGALRVIDGQHRLFAYANSDVQDRVRDTGRIMVTALHIEEADEAEIQRCSAQAFVEINTNQTRVAPLLLHDISFDVLGDRSPRAISAKILTEVNKRRRSAMHGLLRTNDTPDGAIKMTELVSTLAQIANPDAVRKVLDATSGAKLDRLRGYQNLFSRPGDCAQLADGETMMKCGEVGIDRYFKIVRAIYPGDWKDLADGGEQTALRRTKMIAAFIRLLKDFVWEGLDWDDVDGELRRVCDHIGGLGGRRRPSIVFDEKLESIPEPAYKQMDFYRFLSRNRVRKTRIQTVVSSK